MNASFLAIAALISLLALAVLLRPLLVRSSRRPAASRRALNAAIYRDQFDELEKDRASGALAEADFAQARAELQRRLLEDATVADAAPTQARLAWQILVLLALALPTAAFVTYLALGNPRAQQSKATHDATSAEIEQMVANLAARLEQNPDDLRGWAMLARSYKAMRRIDEADRAFKRLGETIYGDPTLLAEYADLLALRANGNIEGKPLQLVEKALQLDPNHLMSLSLAGTAAYDRADYATALRYWERLYKLLPPESADALALAETLVEIRSKSGIKAAPAAAKGARAPSEPAKP